MSESFNADVVEVVFGKIQLESAPEISDSSFQFVSAQSSN